MKASLCAPVAAVLLVLAGCGGRSAREQTTATHPIAPILFATSFAANSPWKATCPSNPTSSFDLQDCDMRALLVVHRRLNSTITSIWGTVESSAGRAKFRASEQTWQRFAKLSCDVRSKAWPARASSPAYAGGSETPVAFASCELDLARAYLKQLQQTYDALKPR